MLRPLLIALALAAGAAGPAPAQTAPPPAPPPAGAAPGPAPLQPGDAFGVEVTLPARTIVFVKGAGTWDKAFDTVSAAFRVLNQYLAKEGIRPAGKAMAIYTKTDDTGFDFEVAVPVDAPPEKPPAEPAGTSPAPAGKALKFTHRGSFDALNTTYEAITNHLDEKRLDAQDMFIEEYDGPLSDNPDDPLVVTIFVPIR
jgi:effector-binding domain-containing protein